MNPIPIVRGVETEIAPARRSRGASTAIAIPVTPAESAFLTQRLRDLAATADSVIHKATTIAVPWPRRQVLERVAAWRRMVMIGRPTLFVVTTLDRAILVDAIEANPYFASMADDDPRLTVDAIRQANALRQKVASALGQKIKRIPLGAGRRRIA